MDQPYAIAQRLSISSVNNTGADLMATIGVAIVERPASDGGSDTVAEGKKLVSTAKSA